MKITQIFSVLTALSLSFFGLTGHAADITAVQSGDWSDTNTWNTMTVPGENDDADIPSGINVIVNTNVTVQFIYDQGTVTMGPNSTLRTTTDAAIDNATTLLATAPSNTVIYSANAYNAKAQDYYNLVFDGLGTFYNGINPNHGLVNMNIAGDLTISGTANIQAGANFNIGGNLTVGTTNFFTSFDCSVATVVVSGNTFVAGTLADLDGSLTNATGGVETNRFLGNMTINPGGTWNVSDVTTWSVGGSFTNNGTIKSRGYGSIAFGGTGTITGKPFTIPTIAISGTRLIGTTITLTTNTPTLNGTLVFDIANTNQIILKSYPGNLLTNYYSGNLHIINTGAAPVSGNSYKFFSATNYGGTFASTSFPSLGAGLSWVDNLATNGSIIVAGMTGSPIITLSRSGGLLTLSWDSSTFPGYSVQAQTNSAGLGTNWSGTGSGTVSPFSVTINPANPQVFFRLSNP